MNAISSKEIMIIMIVNTLFFIIVYMLQKVY